MFLKKIMSFAMAALLLCSVFSAAAPVYAADAEMDFEDVSKSDWFYDAVKFAFDENLMQGTSSTEFEPKDDLNRAMFVTIIGRMAGVSADSTATDDFSDTDKDTWYSPYVGWAVENGIVSGYPDNTFRPTSPMSREQVATVMSRYIASSGLNMPRENTAPYEFSDSEEISDWASDHVEVMRRAGIINGKNDGEFQPGNNIIRAETAQIMMNLFAAIEKAWQGYEPDPSDSFMILGAKYLYSGGTVVAGSLGTSLDESGAYPAIEVFTDSLAEKQAFNQLPGVTGVSMNLLGHDYASMPVVKICYKYADGMTPALEAKITYRHNTDITDSLTVTPGADDEGWQTAYVDLTDSLKANGEIGLDYHFTHLIFDPFAGDETEGFAYRYIGFFEDMKSAEAFEAKDQEDYLKNYFLYSPLDYEELTEEKEAEFEELITDRVNEILNTESEVTPDMFDPENTYYVSSINGDDSNDGKTPETPWKSLSKLTVYKAGGLIEESLVPAGGAVFFERGSEWYAEKYHESSVSCLFAYEGVTYGAYGEGAKPMFSCAVDFTDEDNTGKWNKTEWDNVWVLDELDPDTEWAKKLDVGNIVFNDGQYYGIRLKPTTDEAPFGTDGLKTANIGFCTNGMEYFVSGDTSYENPGTALKNNLEYIHDRAEGKLYLYWDGGNPSDSFDDIKVSRLGQICWTGNDVLIDNLAFLYSTAYGIRPDEKNMTFQNCEIGFCNKTLGLVASGIEIYGPADGFYIKNCYFHEVGDGPLSLQCGASENKKNLMQNVVWEDNVVLTSGCGVELWNYIMSGAELDENGHANYANMINVSVKNNILAYVGHGLSQLAGNELLAGHAVNSSLQFAATENVILEGNLIYKPYDKVFLAYMATDDQPRGWDARGNTYVANPEFASMALTYENVNDMDNRFQKYRRVYIPYNERYLSFLTANGVDPTGKFYYYEGMTDAQRRGCFFESSYYVERGLKAEIN